jgi:hypothetical protein
MKPAIFFNRNFAVACVSALFLLMQGCVTDDLSICGISVHFTYTKNLEGVDKFSSSINKVNLYVFDTDGYFIQEYVVEKDTLPQDLTIYVNLSPGTYDFVAWGNLGEDYEILSAFEKGVTRMDDLQLSLKRQPDNTVLETEMPDPLYHGGLFRSEILATDLQINQKLTIDMMKDTKDIKVIAHGLAVTAETRSAGTPYDCTITSRNGDYKFDNSITGDARLRYIPQASVISADDESLLVSDFVIMREFNTTGITDSRLILNRQATSAAEERVLLDEDLLPYLLAAGTGDVLAIKQALSLRPYVVEESWANLDIWDDTITINLWFDETTGTVSVSVNDWAPQEVTENQL